MRYVKMVFFVVLCCVLWSACAMALECPNDVASVFPMCKDAKVQHTATVQGMTMVSMQVDASVGAAYAAYKSAAQKSGLKIILETKQEDVTRFVGETDDKQVVLNVTKEDGHTLVQLTLGNKG